MGDGIITAIAEAMIPPGGPFQEGGADVPVAGRLREVAADLGYPFWPLVIFALLFNLSPILFFFSFSPFTRLTIEERMEFLDQLDRSRLQFKHMIFFLAKAITVTTFYANPEIGRRIGYPEKED